MTELGFGAVVAESLPQCMRCVTSRDFVGSKRASRQTSCMKRRSLCKPEDERPRVIIFIVYSVNDRPPFDVPQTQN